MKSIISVVSFLLLCISVMGQKISKADSTEIAKKELGALFFLNLTQGFAWL